MESVWRGGGIVGKVESGMNLVVRIAYHTQKLHQTKFQKFSVTHVSIHISLVLIHLPFEPHVSVHHHLSTGTYFSKLL